MKLDPEIRIMCDLCEEDFNFGLTALAGGGWDDRGLDRYLTDTGWRVDGDHHICPDCVEEVESDAA